MDLFPISALTVFLAITAVGFVFLIVSLIFGEIFEFFDHDVDMDHGPGFLSTRVIAVFITAFGAFGAIAMSNGYSTGVSTLVGAGSGIVFGGLMTMFGKFLYGQQASSDVIASDLVGRPARVTVAIPANGIGQVRCRIGEELVDKIAQARGGMAIAENTAVEIEEVLGETVIVKRAQSQVTHA